MTDTQRHNQKNKLHEQHAQDKENDRMDTGTFPVVRRKPKLPLNGSGTRGRIVTSILIIVLCATLGFGYAIQLNNPASSYETMSEDELTRLISQTSTQVQNLQDRKTQLTNQLDSLKAAVDKQAQAKRIAQQNADASGLLSGRLPAQGQGVNIVVTEGSKKKVDAATLFELIEELRNAGAEVMAFNAVRVVTSTYVSDTKNGVECDGSSLTAPYTIKAIGDPQNLQNAVNIAGGVGSQLKVQFGANVTVTSSSNVVIGETVVPRQYTYAKTVQ